MASIGIIAVIPSVLVLLPLLYSGICYHCFCSFLLASLEIGRAQSTRKPQCITDLVISNPPAENGPLGLVVTSPPKMTISITAVYLGF